MENKMARGKAKNRIKKMTFQRQSRTNIIPISKGDKYKDKLKSHNWVGRTYINGQQKIISSGTTDLEKAKVILEKWYDDLHAQSAEKIQTKEENQQKTKKKKNKKRSHL